MSKPVIFRRGNLEDFGVPIDEFLGTDDSSLYFVENTNEIYKSVGNGLPLVKFSDVLSGFENGEDLISEIPVGVEGKIYLLDNGKIYYYQDNEWKTVTAEAQIESITSDKVEFTRTDTTLTSTNVNDAIKELDDKFADVDTAWKEFEF